MHRLGPFSPRRLMTIVALTFAWCALWGVFSFANVASGLVVGTIVSSRLFATGVVGGVRPVPLLKFFGLVAWDLVVSTVGVAREILTPTDYTEEGIVAVDVPAGTRSHFLLLIIAITVTPGTAVVDGDPDSGRLYLHLLHVNRCEATIAHVRELAELACQALPVSGHQEVST